MPATRVDRYGDPLPAGAMLRLGTIRLRQNQHVHGVAFSPDGKNLISTGGDDSIRFWDVATGELVRQLRTDEGDGTYAVAFSPDGQKLASVSERGFVRLWDLQSENVISKVLGHVDRTYGVRVYGVAFAPDGLTFATAGADKSVRLWDAATGTELLELQSGDGGGDARPVAFSPNGRLLASGNDEGTIQIWNLDEGSEARIISKAHERDIVSLVFTADGNSIVTSGTRFERTGKRSGHSISQIHMWDVAGGEKLPGFEANEELAGQCTLAISRDGRTLVSSHSEKIVIWDIATRSVKHIIRGDQYFGGRTHGLAISPDDRLIASATFGAGTNKVYLWNAETGEPVLPQDDAHTEAVLAMDLLPDHATIVTGSADSTVRLWDAATGEHLRLLDQGSGWVRYVEFFPDGESVALGRETYQRGRPRFEGEVKICNVADGTVLQHFSVPDRVMCGALAPQANMLAVGIGLGMDFMDIDDGPAECKVVVWNLASGSKMSDLSGHTQRIHQVQFMHGGEQLWSTGEDQTMRRWNLADGKFVEDETFDLNAGGARHAWPLILSGGDRDRVAWRGLERIDRHTSQGVLALHELGSKEPRWRNEYAKSWPFDFAASEDGKLVAAFFHPLSGKQVANRIAILSADDGRELLSFELDDASVRSLAFSPDGDRLLSGMVAGDTLVWDISRARNR